MATTTQYTVTIVRRVGSLNEWDVFVNGNLAGTVNTTVSTGSNYFGAIDYDSAPITETIKKGEAANQIISNYITNPPS